jgi:hypothetical protein
MKEQAGNALKQHGLSLEKKKDFRMIKRNAVK